jgi:leader peptidase (prepilin peptidase) / N-methyltransferase
MSAVAIAASAVAGVVVAPVISLAVERVPEKQGLRRGPFPEVARTFTTLRGLLLVAATAALFAGVAIRLGATWELPAFLLLAAALVALSLIDLRLFILPNRIVFPVTAWSLVLLAAAAVADGDADPLLRALGCATSIFLVFFVLHLLSPRALGFGDVKLSFLLGLALGWLGVGEAVLGIVLGFVLGALIGVLLLVTRIKTRKDHVPFGPFLAAGAMVAVLAGEAIIDWYTG